MLLRKRYQKMKKKLTNRAFWHGIVSIIFFFSVSVCAQTDNNPAPSGSPGEEEMSYTQEAVGYWELNGTNNAFNPSKITNWTGSEQKLTGESVWKDVLEIQHTVSSSFKWEKPPERMIPGMELNLTSEYIDNEYSTTGKIATGIKIYIDKIGIPINKPSLDAIEVVKLNKDYRQHISESKRSKFAAPKFYIGKSKDIQVIVDCYVGTDHYVSTYTYTWVNTQ
jgi:hypothetical protein